MSDDQKTVLAIALAIVTMLALLMLQPLYSIYVAKMKLLEAQTICPEVGAGKRIAVLRHNGDIVCGED